MNPPPVVVASHSQPAKDWKEERYFSMIDRSVLRLRICSVESIQLITRRLSITFSLACAQPITTQENIINQKLEKQFAVKEHVRNPVHWHMQYVVYFYEL
jgi:hypothetical protein